MEKWFAFTLAGTKLPEQPVNGFEERHGAYYWAVSKGYRKFTVQRRD